MAAWEQRRNEPLKKKVSPFNSRVWTMWCCVARLAAMIDFTSALVVTSSARKLSQLYQLRAGASLIDIVLAAPLARAAQHRARWPQYDLLLTLEILDGDAVLAYLDGQGIVHECIQRRYGAQGTVHPSIFNPEGNRVVEGR